MQIAYPCYIEDIARRLQLNFKPSGSYKICDIRPAFGDIYYEDIESYDYFGFGDLDVIYGDIRKFYTDEVLAFDVISTHEGMLSGHLALFRNIKPLRKAYLRIPAWRAYLENPESTRFDEDVYSALFVESANAGSERIWKNPSQDMHHQEPDPVVGSALDPDSCIRFTTYFKEQYTTVFHPMFWHDGALNHPDVWFWKDGHVTNNRNSGREYLYLHLMNFQSMRWTSHECRRRRVAWKDNPKTRFPIAGEVGNGVRIDWNGIHALPST
jgi:hypothetical protein